KQREPEQIHALVIRRVDTDLAEIKRARIERARARPSFATILGAKNPAALTAQIVGRTKPAFVTLHNRHHDSWIAGADCQTNPASLPGKTAAEFFPACAAVGTLENSANILAAGHARTGSETPWRSLPCVQRSVNILRIRRVK